MPRRGPPEIELVLLSKMSQVCEFPMIREGLVFLNAVFPENIFSCCMQYTCQVAHECLILCVHFKQNTVTIKLLWLGTWPLLHRYCGPRCKQWMCVLYARCWPHDVVKLAPLTSAQDWTWEQMWPLRELFALDELVVRHNIITNTAVYSLLEQMWPLRELFALDELVVRHNIVTNTAVYSLLEQHWIHGHDGTNTCDTDTTAPTPAIQTRRNQHLRHRHCGTNTSDTDTAAPTPPTQTRRHQHLRHRHGGRDEGTDKRYKQATLWVTVSM